MDKFAVASWCLGGCGDRYCLNGYTGFNSLDDQIQLAAEMEGVRGIELIYPFPEDMATIKNKLKEANLELISIINTALISPEFKFGSLTSADYGLWKKAVQYVKESMQAAKEINCPIVALWLGQDGFDYSMQVDYKTNWDRLFKGLEECCLFEPGIKLALEYKPREPRRYSTLASIGKTLYLCNKINADNLGVLLDFGHSLNAGENPAESVYLAQREDRLFHIHFNDNYGTWDDDMLVGSVRLWQTLEFLYLLEETGYQGWLSLDIFPFRSDGQKASQLSINMIKKMVKLNRRLNYQKIKQDQHSQDVLKVQELLYDLL